MFECPSLFSLLGVIMHCIFTKKYTIQSFQKGCFGNWALGTWKPLFRGRSSKALYCFIQFQCPIPEVYHEINQACIIMQLLYLMHLDRQTDRQTGLFGVLYNKQYIDHNFQITKNYKQQVIK